MVTLKIVELVEGEHPYLRYIPAWEHFRYSKSGQYFQDLDLLLKKYNCTWTGGHTAVFDSEQDLLYFLLKWA